MEVIITADYEAVCQEAVKIILHEWRRKPSLVLGLPTGKTPGGVYRKLIELYQKGKIDFSRASAFTLDEYLGLDEGHPQSFAFYMNQNLYRHINIQKKNIFRLDGHPEDIDTHCQEYEKKIRERGGIDVQILGIGQNGHVGFNEPSSSLASRTRVKTLAQETIRDNAAFFQNKEEIPRFCLTMGIGTIMDAKMVILLASGKSKSEAIERAVEGPVTASVPASVLQLHPNAKIVIDEEAAARLERRDYYKWVFQNKGRVVDFLRKK